jgi:hypothetical protein
MFVYFVISYILAPVAFYYLMDKTLYSAGIGYMIGSIISIILWMMVGSKMIK